jgi:hypothetical protein
VVLSHPDLLDQMENYSVDVAADNKIDKDLLHEIHLNTKTLATIKT